MRMRKNGFTLIELLVVVAIIVVLIAILLPSLNRAREQAKSVKCMSNLKQMGIAVQMYSQEYDGTIPIANQLATTPPAPGDWKTQWWMVRLYPYLNITDPGPWNTTDAYRRAYYSGVFNCPSKQDYNLAGSETQCESYAYNAFNVYGVSGQYKYQKFNFLDPEVLLITDDHTGYARILNNDTLYNTSFRPYNHRFGHNMLFPNGDVQQVKELGVNVSLKRLR